MQNPLCIVLWRAGRVVARQGVEVGCKEPVAMNERACGRTCGERWEGGADTGDGRGAGMPVLPKKEVFGSHGVTLMEY